MLATHGVTDEVMDGVVDGVMADGEVPDVDGIKVLSLPVSEKPMNVQATVYKFLVFTALLLLADGNLRSRRRTIDCRRYVYAPKCRGVSAKRALSQTTNFDDAVSSQQRTDLEDDVLDTALSEWEEDPVESSDSLLEFLLSQLVDKTSPSHKTTEHQSPQTDQERKDLLRLLMGAAELIDDGAPAR